MGLLWKRSCDEMDEGYGVHNDAVEAAHYSGKSPKR